MKDYHAILGVRRGASTREIKKAYRQMVKRWHPDFHPDDPRCCEKIKEINEAFAVLSKPEKRREYNKSRESWEKELHRREAFYTAKSDHPFFSFAAILRERLSKQDRKEG